MPFVPTYNGPQIQPSAQPAPFQAISATPADFGAGIGQAIAGGTAIEKASGALDKIADLHNAAVVEDTLAKQYYPAAAKITGDFYSKSGADALAAYPKAQEALEKLRDDIKGGLGNAFQQKAFDGFATRRIGADLEGMSRHAATEGKTFQKDANAALVNAAVNGGIQNWTDPNYVERSMGNATGLISLYGQVVGWTPEMIDGAKLDATTKLYGGVVQQKLANGDALGAQAYFGAHKADIKGAAQITLLEQLHPHVTTEAARAIVDPILPAGGGAGTGGLEDFVKGQEGLKLTPYADGTARPSVMVTTGRTPMPASRSRPRERMSC